MRRNKKQQLGQSDLLFLFMQPCLHKKFGIWEKYSQEINNDSSPNKEKKKIESDVLT